MTHFFKHRDTAERFASACYTDKRIKSVTVSQDGDGSWRVTFVWAVQS